MITSLILRNNSSMKMAPFYRAALSLRNDVVCTLCGRTEHLAKDCVWNNLC